MRLRDYHHQLAVLFFLVIFGIGLFVRLDQFLLQILIDDEWHAVHQLLHSTPANIATSFGHADYSIPLTLLYWFEAEQFGLSELLMRWPMMLAGILTLIVFPLYVFRQFSQHEAILFGSVIALSPLLVIYSRTARPYAITLFLVYLSVWAFYRFYDNADTEKPGQRLRYALLYCVSAAMAVWLHLIAGFFVVAPFILEASRLIIKPTVSVKRNLLALLSIGLPALALIWLLILPPLVNSLHALTVKAGSDLPSIDSLTGALYLWIGTRSGMLVIACCFLGLIGFPRVIKQSVISINILLGFVLTVLLILVSQPAWVQHPLTLARYLLPILPLLLLSIACGLYTIRETLLKHCDNSLISILYSLVCFSLGVLLVTSSPLDQLLRYPNRNTLHSVYSIDFRMDKNLIDQYLRTRSYSEFWKLLAQKPPGSSRIAVAPWYFESFHWDAPIWEALSHQQILPGYLIGLCVDSRAGEVPDNERFRFRNVSYPGDPQDIQRRSVDFIVYQKPNRLKIKKPFANITGCDDALQHIYGAPVYEDDIIKVYQPLHKEHV